MTNSKRHINYDNIELPRKKTDKIFNDEILILILTHLSKLLKTFAHPLCRWPGQIHPGGKNCQKRLKKDLILSHGGKIDDPGKNSLNFSALVKIWKRFSHGVLSFWLFTSLSIMTFVSDSISEKNPNSEKAHLFG